MRPADIADLLKGLAVDVREFIGLAIAPLSNKQAEFEQRLADVAREKAVPGADGAPGAPGASAYELACATGFEGTTEQWLDSLRGAAGESVRGDPGEAAVSLTLDDIAPLVNEGLARAVAEIHPGRDGTSVSAEDVRPMLRELVDAAVATIPHPEDGHSVTLEDVAPVIEQACAKHVEAAQPALVKDLHAALDTAVLALRMPDPVPGKDGADGADGKDGQSVTLEDVLPIVEAAVAKIERPKGLTPEDVRPLVQALVDQAAAAIPPPADGHSVTPEDVRPLIVHEVAEALARAANDEEPLHTFTAAVVAKFASAVLASQGQP